MSILAFYENQRTTWLITYRVRDVNNHIDNISFDDIASRFDCTNHLRQIMTETAKKGQTIVSANAIGPNNVTLDLLNPESTAPPRRK